MDSLGLYKKSVFTFYVRNSRAKILRCKVWKWNFWFKKRRHRHYYFYYYCRRLVEKCTVCVSDV